MKQSTQKSIAIWLAAGALGLLGATAGPVGATASTAGSTPIREASVAPRSPGGSLILRAKEGRLNELVRDVHSAGGTVTRRLGLINAVAVRLPVGRAGALATSPALDRMVPDLPATPQGSNWSQTNSHGTTTTVAPTPTTVAPTTVPPTTTTSITPTTTTTTTISTTSITSTTTTTTTPPNDLLAVKEDAGSMYAIDQQIGADQLWRQGVTGSGVDIAVIDTGVAPVPGLAGKIIAGPDISLDHPYTTVVGVDAFGHGTHMASIAAGLDPGTTNLSDPSKFVGVAPGARIVNVKVGAFDGSTDVSEVVAGIDWVVQHKNDNGLNIKVLNLSYGTESTNSSYDDPLSWAAEAAFRNGIVVVAAAGNDGGQVRVLSPAYNPVVLAVGSVDQAKQPLTASDFTNGGFLKPDIWAPGEHILGLRVPGSFLDARFPTARVGTRLFRGSGTSQATAVVSGSAALLAAAHPEATPSQLSNAIRMSAQDVNGKITGFIDVAKAKALLDDGKIPNVKPIDLAQAAAFFGKTLPPPGTGSLEASRGGVHLVFNLVPLVGEVDIFGKAWDATASSAAALAGTSWNGGVFNGSSWSGSSWSGSSWSGSSWSGSSWSGSSWSSNTWAGSSWSGSSWSGSSWSGSSWSGSSWSGSSWSGNSWSGSSWSSGGWRGNVWG